MKQGSGKTVVEVKREPHPRAINPAGVAQMGNHVGNHVTEKGTPVNKAVEHMHAGRGFTAPKDDGRTIHHGGSQKRHG